MQVLLKLFNRKQENLTCWICGWGLEGGFESNVIDFDLIYSGKSINQY